MSEMLWRRIGEEVVGLDPDTAEVFLLHPDQVPAGPRGFEAVGRDAIGNPTETAELCQP